MPAAPPARTLTLDHLTPSEGLTPTAEGWHARGNRVGFAATRRLAPGWYRLELRIRSHENFTVRKRAELAFDAPGAGGQAISKDVMAWNRTLDEGIRIHLPRETERMTLSLFHAEGGFALERCELVRIGDSMVALAALREKLRLLKAYRCWKPALRRGVGLLLRGHFGAFRAKVLKGLADSRVMRLGAYKADEVDASWWRRHALPPAEAAALRRECDAMLAPPPLAVLLLVDPEDFDRVRLAAHSVRRQIYPHWELLLAGAGPHRLQQRLVEILGDDPRVKITVADADDGLAAAVARSIANTGCKRVVVLPPTVELSEGALHSFAGAVLREPDIESAWGRIGDGDAIWLTRPRRLPDRAPEGFTPEAVNAWVTAELPAANRKALDATVAFPLDISPLADRARIGSAAPAQPERLFLAGDLTAISGWDHVVYALLRGLPSLGVELVRHPVATIRAELVPPQFLPATAKRLPGQKQLAVAPPFLADRFAPDADTALFTMWETDALPPACVRTLNRTGLVIVPSRWSVECFRRSGVTAPMEVVPLGCDQLVYRADGSFPDICTFGTAGALAAGGMRKNAQRIIDVFRRAFPTEPDVRLRVKISPSSPAVEAHGDDRIDIVRAALPHAELGDWYRSLTAYVNGSFGEGFGLHLLEAMACGRPLVTADYSGLTAYFEPHLGYAVAHELVPVKNDIYIGRWAEPSEVGLAATMRRIYADPAEARALGECCAARARNFSWKAAGRQLHAVLRKHGFLTGGPA